MSEQLPASSSQSAQPPVDWASGQMVRLETKRRLIKKRYDDLKAENEAIKKELDAYKARPIDPTVEQLRAELMEIKHRKVFDPLAIDAKALPAALDDLWRHSGFKIDPHSDVINEDALKALIADQQKARPYLFGTGNGESAHPVTGDRPETEPKLEPGPGNTRGGLVRDAGKFRVTRRQLRDQEFMQFNQAKLNEEWKKDNVEVID